MMLSLDYSSKFLCSTTVLVETQLTSLLTVYRVSEKGRSVLWTQDAVWPETKRNWTKTARCTNAQIWLKMCKKVL